MTRPRVVITGVAGVTPLANDIETTWKRLLAGESGIAPITLFDASAYDSRIAGEVKNFVPENYMPPKQVRRMDRFTQFAVASAKMLLQDADFEVTEATAYDVAVILGVGLGGLHTLETYHTKLLSSRRAPGRIQDFPAAGGPRPRRSQNRRACRQRGGKRARGRPRAMQNALREAGIAPEAVGHINAHATSTQLNDSTETKAIKLVFGEHAGKIKISATKSMTGHLLGAAGGIETVFTALALREEMLPGTINLENPDPECDLDYLADGSRHVACEYAMCNSFGFGGTNASLILKKWTE